MGVVLAIGISPDSFSWVFSIHQMKYLNLLDGTSKSRQTISTKWKKKKWISSATLRFVVSVCEIKKEGFVCFLFLGLYMYVYIYTYIYLFIYFGPVWYLTRWKSMRATFRRSHQHQYKSVELHMRLCFTLILICLANFGSSMCWWQHVFQLGWQI